jgi:hypothetical protein
MLGELYEAPKLGEVCTGSSGAGFKRDLIDAMGEGEYLCEKSEKERKLREMGGKVESVQIQSQSQSQSRMEEEGKRGGGRPM